MLDNFALLNEARRPWLEAEPLKQKFLALSSEFHPDRAHAAGEAQREAATRRFAGLNAAWQCLREPKERIGPLPGQAASFLGSGWGVGPSTPGLGSADAAGDSIFKVSS